MSGTCSAAASGIDPLKKYWWVIQPDANFTMGVISWHYNIIASSQEYKCKRYLGASNDCTKKSLILYDGPQGRLTQWRLVPPSGDVPLTITSTSWDVSKSYVDVTVAPPDDPKVMKYEVFRVWKQNMTAGWPLNYYYDGLLNANTETTMRIDNFPMNPCTTYVVEVVGRREENNLVQFITRLPPARTTFTTEGC